MSDHIDNSDTAAVPELQQEIEMLRSRRRQVVVQHCAVPLLAALFALGADRVRIAQADAWWLAAIAFALISWAAGRAIADTVAALEEECPTCGKPFFGGLRRAWAALPLPPAECVHCGLRLDAPHARRPESDSAAR